MANNYVSNGCKPDFREGVNGGFVKEESANGGCLDKFEDKQKNTLMPGIDVLREEVRACRNRILELREAQSKIQNEIDSENARCNTLNFSLETLGYETL